MRAGLARLTTVALCVLAPIGVISAVASAGTSNALSVINTGDSRSTVGQPMGGPLEVHVATSTGAPVAGVAITFTLPTGSVASATFPGGAHSITVKTGASGNAITPVATVNTITGSYYVRASGAGLRSVSIARSNQAAVADFALVGSNHELWVRRTTYYRWTSLGGNLTGTPVVLRSPSTAEYAVALASTGTIWMRPISGGSWVRIAPTSLHCTNIGAYWGSDGVLHVTCRSSNGGLFAGSYDLPQGHLPDAAQSDVAYQQVATAANGPAAIALPSASGDAATVYPVSTSAVATTNLATGSTTTSARACSGAITAAVDSATTPRHVFYACRASNGHLHYWYTTATGSSPTYDAGGNIVGTPGIATTTNGRTATVYARSSKGQVWSSTLGIRGASRWVNYGGKAIGGIGALAVVN